MYAKPGGHVKFEPTQTPGRISHDDETAYEEYPRFVRLFGWSLKMFEGCWEDVRMIFTWALDDAFIIRLVWSLDDMGMNSILLK